MDIGAVEAGDSVINFQFAQSAFIVNEGDGRINITVTREGGLDAGDTSVDYATSDGAASARADYAAAFGTLHFAAGETSKTFNVLVTDDAFNEGDETVFLRLNNPTGGANISLPDTSTLPSKTMTPPRLPQTRLTTRSSSSASTTLTSLAAADRGVADSESLKQAEFNAAFVLLEYFGYLRRNPTDAPDANDDGYQFWLNRLNQFDGSFVRAEMVKAFITSDEYRRRFGPQ